MFGEHDIMCAETVAIRHVDCQDKTGNGMWKPNLCFRYYEISPCTRKIAFQSGYIKRDGLLWNKITPGRIGV